jgi:hypothetical protein
MTHLHALRGLEQTARNVALLSFVIGCGPTGEGSGSGGAAAGGVLTGGAFSGGSASGGALSSGGTSTGGTATGGGPSDGGSTTGGSAPSSGGTAAGGTDASGGADNTGGSGGLPNWESNPPNAEFFRACLDPSGHEIVLRVKTPDGCLELTLTDDLLDCVPLPPEGGWCVKSGGGNYYSQPELCDEAGLTATGNPSMIIATVNEQIIVSEGARLDAAFAIYWGGGYTTAPPEVSVSGCIANCEERDCREQ